MTLTMRTGGQARVRAAAALAAAALLLCISCSRPEAAAARYLERGKARLAKQDYSRASLELRNAVRLAPKSAEARYQLGLAQMAVQDIRGAVASFRAAVDLDPRHEQARVKLAQILAAAGDDEAVRQAQEIARRGLDVTGDNADLMNVLALSEARLGRPEEAERRFQETLARFPDDLGAVAGVARVRLERNDFAGAEAVLTKAASLRPPAVAVILALGELYVRTNRYDEARARFDQALGLKPGSAAALIGLADVSVREGKLDEAGALLKRVAASDSSRYRLLYPAFLFGSGRQQEAIAEFQALVKRDPRDREARTQLVIALVRAGRRGKALQILNDALRRNARDSEALLQRAGLTAGSGEIEAAQKDLDQLSRLNNGSPFVRFLQGKLHSLRGEPARAEQQYGEAIKADPQFLAARLALADVMMKLRKPLGAVAVLDAAPREQQDLAAVAVARIWALLAAGDFDAARRSLADLTSRPGVPPYDSLLQAAALKMKDGDHAAAQASLEAALSKNPSDWRAAELLARSLVSQRETAAAAEKLRGYVSKAPESAQMQVLLGHVLVSAGDAEGARRAFETASALNTRLSAPQIALAEMDARGGALEAARQRLTKLAAASPRDAEALISLALLEERSGRHAEAIAGYRKALDLDPSSAVAANNLAYLLVDSAGSIDEGLKYAQDAKRLAPANTAVDDTLGWALYHKGLYAAAVRHLETAAAAGGAVRKYHLAMAYFRAGEKTRARAALDAALRLDPNVPEAKMARELIAGAEASSSLSGARLPR